MAPNLLTPLQRFMVEQQQVGMSVPPTAPPGPMGPPAPVPMAPPVQPQMQEPEPTPPPQYQAPSLLIAPRPTAMQRMGSAMANTPDFHASPYESGGSRAFRGFLAGAQQGFGGQVVQEQKRTEAATAATNTRKVTEADRNYAAALKSWENKLSIEKDERGQYTLNAEMVSAAGLPAEMLSRTISKRDFLTAVEKKQAADALLAKYAKSKEPGDEKLIGALVAAKTITGGQGDNLLSTGMTFDERKTLRLKGVPSENNSSSMYASMAQYLDPRAVATAVYEGRTPPDLSTYGKGFKDAVQSILLSEHPDYNQTAAVFDYRGILRHYLSLNGGTQVRFQQAIRNAQETIPAVRELLATAADIGGRYGLRTLNSLYARASQAGFTSSEEQNAIAQLYGLATTLQFELAVTYQGGGVPTDIAMKKAGLIINPDAPISILIGQLVVADKELLLRTQAIIQAGAITPSNPAGQDGRKGFYMGETFFETDPEAASEAPAPAAPKAELKMGKAGASKKPAETKLPAPAAGMMRITDGTQFGDMPVGSPMPAGWRAAK